MKLKIKNFTPLNLASSQPAKRDLTGVTLLNNFVCKIRRNPFIFNRASSKTNSGFTLVETLVAVFVVVIAVVAPMAIASKALSATRYAKEEITAYYLAQEGVELARSIRDNNALRGFVWNGSSLGSSSAPNTVCYTSDGCIIDAQDLAVSSCNSSCSSLIYNSQSGVYGYTSSPPNTVTSPYVRKINLESVDGDEIRVTSTVTWTSPTFGASRSVYITDNLKNWQ